MSTWISTSYLSPKMLSVRSQLLLSFNPKFSSLGAKSSKCQIFILQPKQWFNIKIRFYSSTWVQGYARLPKQSLKYQLLKIHATRWLSLPRETWFLMEPRFEILRLPLDSWHQNESGGDLNFWFWVLIGPTRKTRHI